MPKRQIRLTAEQKEWLKECKEQYDSLGLWTGLDPAIIGVITRCSDKHYFVYDREKVVELFMVNDGMTMEMAEEWVSFNIDGAWVGSETPFMLMDRMPLAK